MDISNFEMSRNLQDFLICFEMLLAAIAHTFVFSHKPFVDDTRGTNPMFYSLSRIVDFTDERTDVYDHFRHISMLLNNLFLKNVFKFKKKLIFQGTQVKNIWSQDNQRDYTNIENSTAPLIPLEVRKTYGGISDSSKLKGFEKI